jgi:Cytotoxic translational repressor of toxin-antitoxin stability system
MKVKYSKEFIKSTKKLSGKVLNSVADALEKVKKAKTIDEITDCKKLSGYRFMYRLRVGNLRVFFIFHIDIENDCVGFEYLLNRGEAYKKETEDKLRKKDN